MGSGGQQNQATQTTTTQLSPEQQQLINLGMPFAQQFAANQPQLPSGSSVAGFNPTQTQAQNMATGAAGGPLASEAASAQGAQQFLTSGAALDPSTNPGLAASIKAAQLPIQQNFTETVMPTIRSEGVGAGQFGGSREGVAEGIASQSEQQQEAGVAANLVNQNYQNALDQMTRAMGLTPTVQQASLAPAQAVGAVGDVQQALQQEQLTEAFNRFMFPQEQPISTAEELMGLGAGIPGGSATTVASGTQKPSGLQTALGLGTLGAGLFGGQGMFGSQGAFSGAPAAVGNALSSILPALLTFP
jgi:hypothetical protein